MSMFNFSEEIPIPSNTCQPNSYTHDRQYRLQTTQQTRSHPEMVGDMSRVTLNYDVSKIPFVRF